MADRHKVLVVDDEPDQIAFVKAVLEEAGYAAVEALSRCRSSAVNDSVL